MMRLFDDEYILRTYVESEKKEAAEKAAKEAAKEAAEKATKEAAEKVAKDISRKLYASGVNLDVIAYAVGQPVGTVEEWVNPVSV